MRRTTISFGLAPLALGAGGLLVASLLLADAPAPPKVSTFAPADDLVQQVGYYIGRTEESLSNPADYDEAKQSRTKKDANTLAVLGLVLGMHDGDNRMKPAAASLVKASQALAESGDSYENAAKALADVKKSAGGADAGGDLKWQKVADLPQLMKQVPVVHAGIKRAAQDERRFPRQAAQIAAESATLAAIAQAAMFESPKTDAPGDQEKWYQFCAEMRDSAGAVNSAAHAGKHDETTAALKRMAESCDRCHEVFRKKH